MLDLVMPVILVCCLAVFLAWLEDRRGTREISEIIQARLDRPSPLEYTAAIAHMEFPEVYNPDGTYTEGYKQKMRDQEAREWEENNHA